MAFIPMGTITLDEDWQTLTPVLDSGLLKLSFTTIEPVSIYTSGFIRLKVGNQGHSGKWYRFWISGTSSFIFVTPIPVEPNQVELKLSSDRASRGQYFVVTVEQFVDGSTPTEFTIGGETFLVNGEAFLI